MTSVLPSFQVILNGSSLYSSSTSAVKTQKIFCNHCYNNLGYKIFKNTSIIKN